MMESASAKGCSICNEDFDENERCPRTLPCCHCFCTQCITKLINKNDKKCPFCRQSFMATSAQHLKVNFIFLELLKSMKELEAKYESLALDAAKSSSLAKGLPKSRSELVEHMKENIYELNSQHITSLDMAENNIRSAIESNNKLKEKLCVNHYMIQYEIVSKLTSLANTFKMKMKYIDEVNAKHQQQLKEIIENNSYLRNTKEKLDGAKKFSEVDEAVDEAEACNESVQNWLQDLNMVLSRHEEVQQGFQKNIEINQEKIKSLMETLDLSENEDQGYIENMAVTILQKNIKPERMKRSKMSYPNLEEMMAVQTLNGKTRYGKFSIYESKLCLHSLRDIQQIPSDIYTVDYGDVMSLVDPSLRTAFLDIGKNESTLGRILIRLTPDTKRANNFFLLSSAESGPSYINTKLLHVGYKSEPGEFVTGGDYEYNIGYGGKGVVEGAGEEDGGRPNLAGSVSGFLYGDKYAAMFCITTRDNPRVSRDTVFGKVESGLNILRETIINYPYIKDVYIIDCGIVLDL